MQKVLSGVMNIGMHVVSFLLDGYCCESAALMQKAHPVGTKCLWADAQLVFHRRDN